MHWTLTGSSQRIGKTIAKAVSFYSKSGPLKNPLNLYHNEQIQHVHRSLPKISILQKQQIFNLTTRATPGTTIDQKSSKTTAATTTSKNDSKWTKKDEKMLEILYEQKKSLDQISIHLPHRSIEAIQDRLRELEQTLKADRKSRFQRWTDKEDKLLAIAIEELGTKWDDISSMFFSGTSRTEPLETDGEIIQFRSPRSCQNRWKFLHQGHDSIGLSSEGYRTGAWSPEELKLLKELVNPNPTPEAPNRWLEISRAIGTRSPTQCQSVFKTVLHKGYKGKWTEDEVNRLLEARELYGGDWQKVSEHVGTRAPSQVRQKCNQFSDDVLRRLKARKNKATI